MKRSKDLFMELREAALSGEINPLMAYGQAKQMKKEYDAALAEIEALAIDEASRYSEKQFHISGYSFTKKSGGVRYSFKKIPKWNDLKSGIKDFENKCIHALKSKEKNILVADENGEEIPLPEVIHVKDSLIVKKHEQ